MLDGKLGAILVLVDESFEQPQRVADHFRIGGGFRTLLELLQAARLQAPAYSELCSHADVYCRNDCIHL